MGDDLAEQLFKTLIVNTPAVAGYPTPTWRQLSSADRETWERIATVARHRVTEQIMSSLDGYLDRDPSHGIEDFREAWGS